MRRGSLTNIICLMSALFPIFINIKAYDPRITTGLGDIIGRTTTFTDSSKIEIHEFLGVPFAKPPLGELRFQKPASLEPWSEPLECKTMPKSCMQLATAPYPWAMDPEVAKQNVDEDCLYMNIWVPVSAGPQNKKAVFLWIHGGGLISGGIRQEIYDGRVIAGLGDVIVVTTNYRVGSFGFWSSDQETAPGNVALQDLIAALRWVHTYIEDFGGDNTQITLAGESAGSVAAGIIALGTDHSLMIRRIIMQSGSPASILDDIDFTAQRSLQLAIRCKCTNDSYTIVNHPREVEACMRGIDAFALIKEEGQIDPGASRSFRPRYTVPPLTKNPRIYLRKGEFRHVDLFIGTTSNEGGFLITTTSTDLFGFHGEKDPQITREQAENILKNAFNKFSFADEVIQHYLPEGVTDFRAAVVSAVGDFTFVCSTVFYAEKFAEQGLKVYYFNFNHRPSNTVWADWMGTAHYEEVQFIFGQPFLHPERCTAKEKELSRVMIEHWTTFTKEGTPYPQSHPETWPYYSKETPTFLWYNITQNGIEQSEGLGPNKEHCDFFRKFFDWFEDQ